MRDLDFSKISIEPQAAVAEGINGLAVGSGGWMRNQQYYAGTEYKNKNSIEPQAATAFRLYFRLFV